MRTVAYLLSIGGTAVGNASHNDNAAVAAFAIATVCLIAGALPRGALARAMVPLVLVFRRKL